MDKILNIIANEFKTLGINYHYLYNKDASVTYPYITAEYTESDYSYEDNSNRGDMLLEVWNRDSNLELISLNQTIKNHFRDLRVVLDNVVAHISYANSTPIRTNDVNLNKIEIHLDITYWEGESE